MSILDVPGISKAQLEARVTGITDEVVEARDMAQAFAIDSLGSVIESHAIVLQAPLDAAKATEDALEFKVSRTELADPLQGATMVARSTTHIYSMFELQTVVCNSNLLYLVRGYIAGSLKGGGVFYWDATKAKSSHDGRDVISPTVPWNGLLATVPNYLAAVGETAVGALGCFVRTVTTSQIEVDTYGGVSASALNRAIQKVDTGSSIYTGGQIVTPTGQWSMNGKVVIDNPASTRIQGVTLKGRGKQATTLDFASQPAGQNGVEFMSPIFVGMEDMGVRNAKASGVKFIGPQTIPTASVWNHVNLDRVRISFNAGIGLELDRGFMGNFNQVFTTHNGGDGINGHGLHTSLHFNNCYAASNALSGHRINEATYSVWTACAADGNGQHGYSITKSSTLVLNGCGSESNARAGIAVTSSAALGRCYPILINGFLAYNNNTANAGYPNLCHVKASDGVGAYVVARGCRSQNPANPTVDVLVDGIGAEFVDEDNDFPNGVQSSNGGYVHYVHRARIIRALSVTAATAIVELKSPQGHQGSFGGEILIQASISDPSSSAVRNSATYKLLIDKGVSAVVVEMFKAGLTTGGGASHPSFTWSMVGNQLTATPIGSTSGSFYFEILTSGFVRIK